ncbi:MAG: phosphate ABC transporter substrate-binding protein [Polyangia bacterium]
MTIFPQKCRQSCRVLIVALLLVAPTPGLHTDVRAAAPVPAFRVIVNPENPTTNVDRKFVADIFLKKATRWGQLDSVVRPVDLRPDSPARRAFDEEVLRRSVSAVRNYWQQMVFTGRDVPPPELNSEEEMVAYVLRYPGAIGYVSGTIALQGAKVLTIK